MEKTFGEWIRARRLEAKRKSYESAAEAGMKKQGWSDYENNRGRNKDEKPPEPRIETMSAIALGLNLPVQSVVDAATYYYSKESSTLSLDMQSPDVHALFDSLDVEDQQELIDIARLKWNRKHPGQSLPRPTPMPQDKPCELPETRVQWDMQEQHLYTHDGKEAEEDLKQRFFSIIEKHLAENDLSRDETETRLFNEIGY